MPVERERLDADVLIVGAGPAGLACALHLSQLISKHNAAGANPELSAENIYVLEKAREIGAHQLSGAVMDPRGLAELVPDWEKTAPLESPVTDDAAYVLTSANAWKLPITPPPLQNHGNYIVSINKLTKWLGGLVEKSGVNLFTQFAGRNLIYEGGGIANSRFSIRRIKVRDPSKRPSASQLAGPNITKRPSTVMIAAATRERPPNCRDSHS